MKLYNSMKVANKVLATVKKLGKEYKLDVTLEPYKNGRENGYALSNTYRVISKKVVFAENRNSDDIVVYAGGTQEFDMAGNLPSEEGYRLAYYFEAGQYNKAAKHIINYLRD